MYSSVLDQCLNRSMNFVIGPSLPYSHGFFVPIFRYLSVVLCVRVLYDGFAVWEGMQVL